MPAVKTSPSRPPRAAASEPISRTIRCTNSTIASAASGAGEERKVRMSGEIPDTPSRPDLRGRSGHAYQRSGRSDRSRLDPVGGDILFIEATRLPGSGKLILTGQLGD